MRARRTNPLSLGSSSYSVESHQVTGAGIVSDTRLAVDYWAVLARAQTSCAPSAIHSDSFAPSSAAMGLCQLPLLASAATTRSSLPHQTAIAPGASDRSQFRHHLVRCQPDPEPVMDLSCPTTAWSQTDRFVPPLLNCFQRGLRDASCQAFSIDVRSRRARAGSRSRCTGSGNQGSVPSAGSSRTTLARRVMTCIQLQSAPT